MAKSEYILLEDPEEFFKTNGTSVIFFSRAAAKRIFETAATRGIAIMRYEGGILTDGVFQPKLDAIWDRLDAHSGAQFLEEGNLRAVSAIEDEVETYNAFVVTGKRVI